MNIQTLLIVHGYKAGPGVSSLHYHLIRLLTSLPITAAFHP